MILRPRKLLAAAAFTTLAACGASRPAGRVVSYPTPVTNAAAATAPTAVTLSDPSAEVVPELVAATVAPDEAAAPRCDEHGRPLAGNVRTKGPMDTCEVASR